MTLLKISKFYLSIAATVVSFLLLIGFMTRFTPDEAGFIMTIVPLFLVWVFLFSFLRSVFHITRLQSSVLAKISSLIIPSVLVLTLMFSALGDVSVLDAILLFVLASLGNFYLARTWPK
jgi:hypothetical protein